VVKIPSASNIPRAVASGQRQVTSIDTRSFAPTELAQALKGMVDERDRYESSKAESDFLILKNKQDNAYDQDEDYKTIGERYTSNVDKGLAEVSMGITNPRVRAEFLQRNRLRIEQGKERMKGVAFGKEKDFERNSVNDSLNNLREMTLTGSPEDVATARNTVNARLDAAVSMGYYSNEQAGKIKRHWKVDSAIGRLKMMSPEDRIKALNQPVADNIPSDTRVEMIRKAESELKRDANLKKAKASELLNQYKTAVSLGYEVDPQEKARVKELVSGTDQQEEFDRINKTSAFSVLSIDERNEQLNSAETGKLDDVADFTAMLKANNEVNRMAIKDGYSLGVQQGIIDEIAFNPLDPSSLTLKADQAEILSDHYGVSVSPLSDSEANSLSSNIDSMTVAEKVQLANTLNSAPSVWGQISPKNQQAFSMAGATGDDALMTDVFNGQELLKEGLVTAVKASEYLSVSDDFLGDVYGIQDKASILEAAKAHYASTVGNVDVFDGDAWEASLSAVTGGIGEVNGNKIELPRGVDEDTFEDFIDEFSGLQVESLGGVLGFTDNQAANQIQNGKIKSIGSNKYIVMTNEAQALFKKDGEPLIIEFTSEVQAQQEAKKFIKSKTIEAAISKLRGF